MANSTTHKVTVIEHSRVSPPPGTVAASSLPLTFFDIPNISYTLPALFFYKYHNADQNILIPILKHLLSITLKHFSPMSGNLILYDPTVSNRHEVQYVDGDSIQVTFATCDSNFDDMVAKNPINVNELLPFNPPLSYSVVSNSIVAPVSGIQITFFPNHGLCIGITREHVTGDANTWVRFMRAWALVTKTNSDESLLASNLIPSFDRSVITDTKDLYNLFLSQYEDLHDKFKAKYENIPLKYEIFRGTFVVTQAEIQQLKKEVVAKSTHLPHISSFVVVTAYLWSCLAKLRVYHEHVEEEVIERFGCVVNMRERISTIPENYFGNCYLPCNTTLDNATLRGENGVILAAEKIGEAISNLVNNKQGILDGAEKWFLDVQNNENRLWIGGCPKNSLNHIDFGWGMPEKTHSGYHFEGVGRLNGCNGPQSGIEIGLTFSRSKMDAFTTIFNAGLQRG